MYQDELLLQQWEDYNEKLQVLEKLTDDKKKERERERGSIVWTLLNCAALLHMQCKFQ